MASAPQRLVVAAVYVSVMFMSVLDITIVQVGFSAIASDLRASTTTMSWIATGYLLSLAVSIPVSGWLGDRFGARRVLLGAITTFTLASLACALAPSIGWLIACRVLKGLGGGLLAPVGQALLYRTFPPDRRAGIARYLMIPTLLGPALGPIVGGFFIDTWSWRLMFLINVPVGAIALAFGWRALPVDVIRHPGRFDVAGFVLAGSVLATALVWLGELPSQQWTSPVVVVGAVTIVALATALVRVEHRRAAPLIPFRLLSDRLFRSTMVVSMFGTGAFHAVLYLMPLSLQEGRGLPALQSGLSTAPEALGMVLAAQLAARHYPHVGPARVMAVGLVTATVSFAATTQLDPSSSLWLVGISMFLAGAGMAGVNVSVRAATFARVAMADMGRATAMFSAQRQTASAVGAALVLAIVASLERRSGAMAEVSFGPVFAVPMVLATIGLVCTRWVRIGDAVATLAPARRELLEPVARPAA